MTKSTVYLKPQPTSVLTFKIWVGVAYKYNKNNFLILLDLQVERWTLWLALVLLLKLQNSQVRVSSSFLDRNLLNNKIFCAIK